MGLQRFLLPLIFSQLSHSIKIKIDFPVSTDVCPVFPVPQKGCGPFTYRDCDSVSAQCAYCVPNSGTSLTEFTGYPDPPKDYVVDVEDYGFYHVLALEYLVEFSKNPMPFQPKIDLPFCGLPSAQPKNSTFTKRGSGFLGAIKKAGSDIGGAVSKGAQDLGDGLKHLGNGIQKGLAPLAAPFVDEPPPKIKLLPRPICIPKFIQVPIHFTVFTTNYTTSKIVTPEILDEQVKQTNKAFEPLGISFFISSLSYHAGKEWERFTHNKNGGDNAYFNYAQKIKAENRFGGNDEVNVWIVEKIDEIACDTGVRTLGYCTLARHLNSKGHSVDGCAMTIDSLPGVAWRKDWAGDGKTLTHELGHWLDLPHIFPDNGGTGCDGESDGIDDTFQFPNGQEWMFNAKQPRCCASGTGKKKKWGFCSDDHLVSVNNFMSYSGDSGKIVEGADPATMPWTTEQRAHMFAAYFTLRRTPLLAESLATTTPSFGVKRGLFDSRLLRAKDLLRPTSGILDGLKKICATKPDPKVPKVIDVISGEVLTCQADGTCKPPTEGPSCPNGSAPPCSFEPGCEPVTCPEGGSGSTCPAGTEPTCKPKDGKSGKDDETNPGGKDDKKICSAGCNVHSNNCDKTTAPTCIFPDPRVSKPRGACACRPGFKATGAADTDTTKHWRLAIPGQEHRVWVAEGVPCDQLCTISTGFNSCREVTELSAACASV
ncbi:Extracellular metalloprotease [Cladobotryum mycophilum]|uniref:Extracellular metalloprotease n=1 Tax=Cladobotryum mycophilum TaxID=491253 RepID=A0ABR0SC19_9HYPO